MSTEGGAEERLQRQQQGRIILGECALQTPTGIGLRIVPTRNPHITGSSHVIQVVDGRVVRTIAPMAGDGAVLGPRPARRGELRACNCGVGMGIALRARGPVYTRTAGGREEVVYRPQEMDEGRLYAVGWNGGHYALRKSGPDVEIFKFRPDGGGEDGGGGPCEGGEGVRKRGHARPRSLHGAPTLGAFG